MSQVLYVVVVIVEKGPFDLIIAHITIHILLPQMFHQDCSLEIEPSVAEKSIRFAGLSPISFSRFDLVMKHVENHATIQKCWVDGGTLVFGNHPSPSITAPHPKKPSPSS
jgi:hypothetical protein